MSVGIVIPAHMSSSRFPGKPLADVGGKPLLQYAVECARNTGLEYVVATSDQSVIDWCRDYGAMWSETPPCRNGTERAAYFHAEHATWDRIIVLQCDEPDVRPEDLLRLSEFSPPATLVGNMAETDWGNRHSVAAEMSGHCVRRFVRGHKPVDDLSVRRHIGVYMYSEDLLCDYAENGSTYQENMCSLEQLRTMALGYAFLAHDVHPRRQTPSLRQYYRSVNVPEDVEAFK